MAPSMNPNNVEIIGPTGLEKIKKNRINTIGIYLLNIVMLVKYILVEKSGFC
jgi:hypothetical protein